MSLLRVAGWLLVGYLVLTVIQAAGPGIHDPVGGATAGIALLRHWWALAAQHVHIT